LAFDGGMSFSVRSVFVIDFTGSSLWATLCPYEAETTAVGTKLVNFKNIVYNVRLTRVIAGLKISWTK
jgi:hypothetical protein